MGKFAIGQLVMVDVEETDDFDEVKKHGVLWVIVSESHRPVHDHGKLYNAKALSDGYEYPWYDWELLNST